MSARPLTVAVLLAAVALLLSADPAAARRRPSMEGGQAPAAAAPTPPSSEADKVAQSLAQGMRPYVSGGDGQPGWRLPRDIKTASGPDGAAIITVSELTYVLSPELDILLPGLEIKVVPDKGRMTVALVLSGEPQLRGKQGTWASLSFAKHSLSGEWDAKRDSFASLTAQFGGLTAKLANGTRVTFDELAGKFTTQASGATPSRTGHLSGSLSAEGIIALGDGERWRMTADSGRLGIVVKEVDQASQLLLDYTHALTAGRYNGVAGEIVPLTLAMGVTVRSFPWEAALRGVPPWLAEVAGKSAPEPALVWGGLWRRLVDILSASGGDLAVTHLDGRSKGLQITGKGEMKFVKAQEPRGVLNAEIRGINERMATLDRMERKDDPLLYPTLALMTVIGDGKTDNGTRVHRFKAEMVGGGIRVNGRDSSGLKPEP